MSNYLPDGCTQAALDCYCDEPEPEEPQPPAPEPEPLGWMTDDDAPF